MRKRRDERGRGAALIRTFLLAHREPGNLRGCNGKGRRLVHGVAAFQALRVSMGLVVVLRCAEHMRLGRDEATQELLGPLLTVRARAALRVPTSLIRKREVEVGCGDSWGLWRPGEGASYSKRIQSGVPVRGVYSICAVF